MRICSEPSYSPTLGGCSTIRVRRSYERAIVALSAAHGRFAAKNVAIVVTAAVQPTPIRCLIVPDIITKDGKKLRGSSTFWRELASSRCGVEVVIDGDRSVVGEAFIAVDLGAAHARSEVGRYELVVDAPTKVPLECIGPI